MTGCVQKQNQRRCVRKPNHQQWLGPVSEEKRSAGYNVHQSLPLLACWMHRQSNRIRVVSLCLITVMYIAAEITTFVTIRLESLDCLMRFKILRVVAVESTVFWCDTRYGGCCGEHCVLMWHQVRWLLWRALCSDVTPGTVVAVESTVFWCDTRYGGCCGEHCVLMWHQVRWLLWRALCSNVTPGTVVASFHATRYHTAEDSILETNSMELNSWKAISFSPSEEISYIL